MPSKEDEILESLRELQKLVDDIRNGIYEPPAGLGHGSSPIATPEDLYEQNKEIIHRQQELLDRIDRMDRDA